MAETVAITGGSGFLGRHLARRLATDGARVRLVDAVPPSAAAFPWGLGMSPSIEYRPADVCEARGLAEAFRGATAVVHLAAISLPTRCRGDRLAALRVNVVGTATALEAARAAGVSRFVIASSRLVEDAPGEVYSVTKRFAEDWTVLCAGDFPGGVAVARLPNVYGPGQELGTVVPDFMEKAVNGRFPYQDNGGEALPLLYVDDVVAALAVLIRAPLTGVVAVAGGDSVPLLALAHLVAGLARSDGVPVPGDRAVSPPAGPRPEPDARLAAAGWSARVPWTDGVRRTWLAWRGRAVETRA